MTFKIVTDSTADLPESWVQENDVTVLGLTIQLDDVSYETVGENRLTSDVLLEKMLAGGQPTTSQVNVGQFETVFRAAAQAGEAILYLGFSAALSGTYQSATIAREMVLENYPEAVIETFNTKAATLGEGYLVMKAVAARQAGKTIAETLAEIEELAPYLHTYVMVDDLNHLVRGGRLSKAAAMIGGLVNIKPILAIDTEGKLVPIAKMRGKKKGIKEMLRLTLEDLNDDTVILVYTGDRAVVEEIKEALLAEPSVKNVLLEPIGPVIATHTGTGTIGLLLIGKTKR